jgi:hypothetical protein
MPDYLREVAKAKAELAVIDLVDRIITLGAHA